MNTLQTIRILGIDPGLRITGFGLIDKTGQKLAYVTSGCIRSNEKDSLPLRLKTLLDYEAVEGALKNIRRQRRETPPGARVAIEHGTAL